MRLLVRCDADAAIGLGHAGRALSLAEELAGRLGVTPRFVSRQDPLLAQFLEGRGVDHVLVGGEGYDVQAVLDAAEGDAAVVVSDSYELDAEALNAIDVAGLRHVVVDDFARLDAWPCDVVVNPNLGAEGNAYPGAKSVAAGPRYAPLRSAIRSIAERPVEARDAGTRLLVCLGGGDWGGRADDLLIALSALTAHGVEVRAAVEGRALPAGVDQVPRSTLPAQLAWADVGVISGGVLKYEAAATGLPMLLLAAVAHQVGVAKAFASSGAGEYLGTLDAVDPAGVARRALALLRDREERHRVALRSRELVDGRGAERVADLLLAGEET
jgi:UDP-2,4-diacetamido-2,4,6-trideoxy-beta-L-altropyranose hydrolase